LDVSPVPPSLDLAERVATSQRAFVLAMGGFSLDLAGGALVTHERIPTPSFNFVELRPIHPARQSAFFERALDHYFQRAIRPSLRVPAPAPPGLDGTLGALAFRRTASPRTLRWALPRTSGRPPDGITVREATADDLDTLVSFWTDGPHREELRRSLDVLWNHPNPGERLVPLLAERDGRAVGSGVLYEAAPVASFHGVAMTPRDSSDVVSSAIVEYGLGLCDRSVVAAIALEGGTVGDAARLQNLGFTGVREMVEYELPVGAELTMPSPGPAQPPRWRPPRPAPP
jgi:hypothetical protein